jgi:hypothetical protein
MAANMNLTKLEGVNRILRAAREHPVSALGSSTENDSLLAEQLLDEILMREQQTGQHVNTTSASFDIDSGDNTIKLPSNTLAVQGWNQHACRNFFHKEVNGEVLLFDADQTPATSDFSANGADLDTAYVRLTQCLDFESLPSQHQFSVVDQAAVEYQEAVLGDPALGAKLEGRAGRSRAISRAYDMRMRPKNMFADSRSQGPRWGQAVTRSWPYNDLPQQPQ